MRLPLWTGTGTRRRLDREAAVLDTCAVQVDTIIIQPVIIIMDGEGWCSKTQPPSAGGRLCRLVVSPFQ
jgi:hypothetical protein